MNKKKTTTTILCLLFGSILMAQDSPVVNSGAYSKVYKGKDAAFEKAVSAHVSKWHGEGQWNQFGSKVMSGPRSGQYFIGTTNHYWKDYDERKTSDSHDKDWERIFNTYVEENSGMRYYVKVPDASYNDRRSPMFLLTYYNLSPAAVGKKLDLIRKAKEAAEKTKYERSWGVYQVRGANRVLAIAFRMDGMVDMDPRKCLLSKCGIKHLVKKQLLKWRILAILESRTVIENQ